MRGSEIDVNEFEGFPLEPPLRWFETMTVRVSEKGEMILSARLRKVLCKDEKSKIEVKIDKTADFKIITIAQSEHPNYKFPKSGRMKHTKFAHELETRGYGIPAQYIVEWNEAAKKWIGVLEEVEEAPRCSRKRTKK